MNRTTFAAAAAIGMAAGLCGLGALSLIDQEFAAVWQPVPKTFPAYHASAAISGLILFAAGLMLALRRTRAWGAALVAAFLATWAIGLHLPHLLAKPLVVISWNAICESLTMTAGAFVIWLGAKGRDGGPLGRAVVLLMGVCFVVFGTAHFAYADFTAKMVPAFLPFHLQLALLTGAIHILCGLALLLGVRRRWAAMIEAAMMTSFFILVNGLRAVETHDRFEITGAFIALTLSSAVWSLAASQAVERA